jgi:hypothetical protein
MGANRDLRNEYRASWRNFSRRLDELQTCVEAGRGGAEAALFEVENARIAHNAARDRLAEQLLGSDWHREEALVRTASASAAA